MDEIVDDEILERDSDENKFTIINVMCSLLTNMINDVLDRYGRNANILDDEKRKLINMKNEFLFSRIVLTTSKKNYASIQLLKEGQIVPKQKQRDVKGLDIMKTTISEETSEVLQKILEDHILRKEKIEIPVILRELEKFENDIRRDLENGGRKYIKPISVSSVEKYKDPYGEQRVRAVLNWNMLFPDMAINLPDKVDLIKMKTDKLEKLMPLAETNYDLFLSIKKNIFNNEHKQISGKGLDILALPRNLQKIPDWVLPFIDYNKIIEDNVGTFIKILYSIGLKRINIKANDVFYSNIIDF